MEWHTYRARWHQYCTIVCDITFLAQCDCARLLDAMAIIRAMMYNWCVKSLDVYWIRFEHVPRRAQAMQRFYPRCWLCMNFLMLIGHAICCANSLAKSSTSFDLEAWRTATAGCCILYWSSSQLIEIAQCRQALSEIYMRCKVGTRQHGFLNVHTHKTTALNY